MIQRRSFLLLSIFLLTIIAQKANAGNFVDCLPAHSGAPIQPFTYSDATALLSELPLHHIEGIWQFTDNDVEIAVVRHHLFVKDASDDADHYLMIVVSAPNRTIRPGTVMGHISRGGQPGIYNARIYTAHVGRYLTIPKTFTISLDDDGNSFSLRRHNSPLQIFLWRLAPYLWRYPITNEYQNINRRGCIRRFPEPMPPLEPVYL